MTLANQYVVEIQSYFHTHYATSFFSSNARHGFEKLSWSFPWPRIRFTAAVLFHNAGFRLSVQLGNTEILISLNFEDSDSITSIVDFHGHEGIPAKRHSILPLTLHGLLKVLSLMIRRAAISYRPILVLSSAQKGTSISSALSTSLVFLFLSPSRASRTKVMQASSQGLWLGRK